MIWEGVVWEGVVWEAVHVWALLITCAPVVYVDTSLCRWYGVSKCDMRKHVNILCVVLDQYVHET